MEAKLGGNLGHFVGFGSLKVVAVKSNLVKLRFEDKTYELTPGSEMTLWSEIEGREWSDGCVYDSDEYKLTLTWDR